MRSRIIALSLLIVALLVFRASTQISNSTIISITLGPTLGPTLSPSTTKTPTRSTTKMPPTTTPKPCRNVGICNSKSPKVCATNGRRRCRLLKNECEMRRINCRFNEKWTPTKMCKCKSAKMDGKSVKCRR